MGLLLALLLLRAPTLVVPIFNSDEAYLAIQAHILRDGGRLYHDVADRKPPLVPYLYAAVFALRGKDDLIAVHLLAVASLFLTALVLAWDLARRAGGAAAAWAGLLFVLASASYLPAETQAANFEVFMLLPLCLGMAIAGLGGVAAGLGAGVLIGAAALCKQPAATTLLAAAYCLWRGQRRGPALAALGLGFGATVGAAALAIGPSDLYFWTIGGLSGYLSTDGVLGYALLRFLLVTGSFLVANATACWLVIRAARSSGLAITDRWVWLVTSAIGVAAGLRFFGHYYLQLLPPACLIAAPAAAALGPRARRWALVGLAIPAMAFAASGFYSARIHGMPDYGPVSAYVRDHTGPADRIAIWGHFPEVYWASGRMPAMRFVHTGFLTGASGGRPPGITTDQWATPGAWDLLFEDFSAHPPRLLLDTSPAGLRDYDHYPMTHYPALARYVADHYRPAATIDHVVVYERVYRAAAAGR
jgi:hypothetical protein